MSIWGPNEEALAAWGQLEDSRRTRAWTPEKEVAAPIPVGKLFQEK